MKAKILIFSHSGLLGGAEKTLLGFIDILQEYQYEPYLVLPYPGPLENELNRRKINYSIINYCWWTPIEKNPLIVYLASLNRILRHLPLFRSINPDFVLTNTATIPWGAIVATFLNKPHIWSIREFVIKDHGLKPVMSFPKMIRYIYQYSDSLWFASAAVKNEFEKYIPSDKSHVVYTQVKINPTQINQPVTNPYLFSDSLKLIFVGAINQHKGQLQAVKAVNSLISQGKNIELLLLGQSTPTKYFAQIQNIAKRSPRFHLRNFALNPYPYFKLSDAVLVCSKSEAFSRTIVEAGILKKPVIANHRGGAKEIINHNINGLIYQQNNTSDLVQKIKTLLDQPQLISQYGHRHYLATKVFTHNTLIINLLRQPLMR